MNRKAAAKIELAVTAVAAICLGGAAGFAVMSFAPAGAGLLHGIGAGALVALAALAAGARVDRRHGSVAAFAPVEPLVVDGGELTPEDDDALLLDDPLPVPQPESRVVRLFAVPDVDAAAPTAGPGEMIARIEHFLGQGRGAPGDAPVARDNTASDEASAALHAALADIRRSLRQG